MKKQILLLVVFSAAFALNIMSQGVNTATNDSTEIIFNELDHNFGTVAYKGDASFEFVFKNTGKAPLIIKHVQSSCGCTTPFYDTQPVAPKAKGKIMVKFDSERIGPFIKSIKVFSNAKNSPVELIIRGEIKSPENPK
jgi:hypothetical protein